MKQIVVATDLSERSDRAVERALRLAAECNAICTVVSIVDEALPLDFATEIRNSTERQLRMMLDAHSGKDAVVDVQIGDVPAGVLGIAFEREADLLVLGIHRLRGFMDAIRETTMERIVSLSRHPVLMVREPVNAPYARVLVPVSFSRECAAAVVAASRVAPNAKITSFHALHVPFSGLTGGRESEMEKWIREETEQQAREWQARYSLSGVPPEIKTGSVFGILDQMLGTEEPDLLAIGAHTRSGPGFHRLGGFASGLIRRPPTDLLVARS